MAETTPPVGETENSVATTNRYSGKVQGNILDLYDVPTYNLKLYAVTLEALENIKLNDSIDDFSADSDADARNDFASSAVGKSTKDFKTDPEKMIILAQTGVTAGVSIDNLEITTVPGATANETTATFKITQPGAADFLDQLWMTANELGIEEPGKLPLILEIDFQGYQESSTENIDGANFDSEGGQIIHIAGPYRHVLMMKNFTIDIGPDGSEYNFETVIQDDTAYADNYFKINTTFESNGGTITEHLEDIARNINLYNEARKLEGSEKSYEVVWDLESMISATESSDDEEKETGTPVNKKNPYITNESVLNNVQKAGDSSKSAEQIEADKQIDAQKEVTGDAEETSAPVSIKLTHTEGDSLYDCLGRVLSLNTEFMSHATRTRFEADGKAIGEYDKEQTHVWWYTVKAKVTINPTFDAVCNRYSKTINYRPLIISTPSNKTGVTVQELQDTDKSIKNYDITKAYEYMYTGRNDQILNVNISHRKGLALLVPAKKGMDGYSGANLYLVDQAKPVDEDEISSIGDLFDLFKKAKNIFNSLKDMKGDVLAELAGTVEGFGPDKLKEIMADTAGQAAQDLSNALAGALTGDEEVKRLLKGKLTGNDDSPTESDDERQKQIDQYYEIGDYEAKPSGYNYAVDLLTGTKETKSEDLADEGSSAKNEKPDIESGVAQKQIATTYAGAQTNMFNYLYNQNAEPSILQRLTMEVRGDPWYLGDSESGRGNFSYDEDGDNFFIFVLKNPRRFDMSMDEDENTGEYSNFNTSWTMSGLYRLVRAVNNFNNGIYTTEIEAVKETGVDLSNMSSEDFANYNISITKDISSLHEKGLGGIAGLGSDGEIRDPVAYLNGRIAGADLGGMSKEKYIDQIVANEANVTSEYADAWRKAQGGGTRPSNTSGYNGPGPGGGGNNPKFDPGP
jgi:hypothetical protein